ncbi:hypothetical protein DNTS_022823 [Danionella cerebrum]|uniref:Coagulation factor IX n=1 Tax=Danionella cerebrum TaxID=2873325 RepID=A0A553RAQ2_9TELE|nr:hypothetical protein DNTS_022823 [Danionella translucida]TRY99264.1 hypothetical protein DNTS_022823 [Danionella translucida]
MVFLDASVKPHGGVFQTRYATIVEVALSSVFLSRDLAEAVLKRQKRFNSGGFEEMKKDNLERECYEERCSLEEAREVFEDNEQTMKFWITYMDGDQCQSSPCQNGGKCEDGMNTYTCWCPTRFSGKNCELEMAKQCNVNNGGCMHFCIVDKIYGAVCDCAEGYKLAVDGRSCEPRGPFPCGRLGNSIADSLKTRSLISSENGNQSHSVNPLTINHVNTTDNNTKRSLETPPGVNSTSTDQYSQQNTSSLHSASNVTNTQHRIVGGDEATPGEIPWQVVFLEKVNKLAFCGGSLLREHDISKLEGTESDHRIAEYHIHPRYNPQRNLYNHDIALLKLQDPVGFSDFSLPICLGSRDFTESLLRSDQNALVSGWGRLRFGGIESRTLQKVELPYVDRTECKSSSTDTISRFMFCAGYSSVLKDACQGDSGGPHATLYKNTWFLTGIVSWGEECAKQGKYGIYTRVSRYMHWITNVTGIRTGHVTSPEQASVS